MGGTIVDVPNAVNKRRRRSSHVRFKEEEEIINPGTVSLWCSYVYMFVFWEGQYEGWQGYCSAVNFYRTALNAGRSSGDYFRTYYIFYSILLLIVWVRSFSKMLPYVKFTEDKVLVFVILRKNSAKSKSNPNFHNRLMR